MIESDIFDVRGGPSQPSFVRLSDPCWGLVKRFQASFGENIDKLYTVAVEEISKYIGGKVLSECVKAY